MAAVSSIIAGAAIAGTAASGIASANAQRSAARNATNAQVAAANQSTALDREIYYDQRSLLAPSITAGSQARARQMLMQGYSPDEVKAYLSSTASAVGPTGEAARATPEELQRRYSSLYGDWSRGDTHQGVRYDDFNDYLNAVGVDTYAQDGGTTIDAVPGEDYSWVDDWSYESSSPSYDFRLQEGQNALERSAAARGDLFSGGTGRELTRYGQDFASNEFEADWRRLGELAGDGEDATGTTIQVAGNYGNNATSNINAAGNARASGYAAQGQANADMWSTIGGGIGAFYGLGQRSGWFGK